MLNFENLDVTTDVGGTIGRWRRRSLMELSYRFCMPVE